MLPVSLALNRGLRSHACTRPLKGDSHPCPLTSQQSRLSQMSQSLTDAKDAQVPEAAVQGGDPASCAADAQLRPSAQAGQSCEQLEAQYVHQVYDAISPHFSATRFAIWPR